MARGGYRPGSGRPRGTSKAGQKDKIKNIVKAEANEAGLSPLDYMLKVMNDHKADFERRDRMAIAAAPYVHERAADRKLGKKEQKVENAKNNQSIYSMRRSSPKLAIDNTK